MGAVRRARDQLLDRDVAIKEVQIADTLSDAERLPPSSGRCANKPPPGSPPGLSPSTRGRGRRPSVDRDAAGPRAVARPGARGLGAAVAAASRRDGPAAAFRAQRGTCRRGDAPGRQTEQRADRQRRPGRADRLRHRHLRRRPQAHPDRHGVGSPGFTAPERIRGEDASPASDLWSLGATIYAAVEGHGPFEQRGGAITTMSAIINEDAPEAPTAGALGPVIAALLRREPGDRPDASVAARMIADVLPVLADRPPGSAAGYEATALSASSLPAPPPQAGSASPGSAGPGSVSPPGSAGPGSVSPPGSAYPGYSGAVRPRTPQPGENSMAYEPTVIKPPDPSVASTGPPAGAHASAAETAPTTPQPSQPLPPSPGGWGHGAGSGYSPAGSSGPAGSAARPEGRAPDFSSWYDQSPRSGAPSPPGSGSGYPPPAGYAPAAGG